MMPNGWPLRYARRPGLTHRRAAHAVSPALTYRSVLAGRSRFLLTATRLMLGAAGSSGHRDRHSQASAGSFLRFRRAVHRLGRAAGPREPEPAAGACLAEPLERLEDPVPAGPGYPRPAVGDAQHDPGSAGASGGILRESTAARPRSRSQ